jgi:hypothetical protein
MRSFRFRPTLETFEERLTPAVSGADWFGATARTMAAASFFQHTLTDPDWMFNPTFKGFLEQKLTEVFQVSQSAAATFAAGGQGGTGLGAMAQATQAMAIQVGNWVGINVAPAPAPAPTDAGMTNTMPDPNAPNWVPLGAAGLKTWDVVQGTGTPVAAGATITVFYTGWLASNGTQFDARRSPAAPATFALTGLIQGWQQGIPGMKPGGIRRLFIPAALAYGAAGHPPSVPANADLVFEIKLISHT